MDEIEKKAAILQKQVLNHVPGPGNYPTAIEGVGVHRRDAVTVPENCLYLPRIVKIVQGRKHSLVGDEEYFYGENDVFIAGVDMPNTSNIFEASPEKPCMSVTVDIDRNLIAQLAMEMPPAPPTGDEATNGLLVQPVDAEMLDAFIRLVALLDRPERIPVLAPMLVKEIHYRVLIGPGGEKLRALYTYGSQKNQIARAVSWVKENFKERFTIDELAERVHMATSTFHRRFKETTTVSPLQFQKRLRLHEAQRLMLKDDLDANSACDAVGYESLTQFNREYKRLFGEPPRRNITRWQRENANMPVLIPGD